jgi:hypothetical protein
MRHRINNIVHANPYSHQGRLLRVVRRIVRLNPPNPPKKEKTTFPSPPARLPSV